MLLHRRDFDRAGLLTIQWIRELPFTLGVLFFITFVTNQYFENLGRELNDSELGPWPAHFGGMLASLIVGFALLMIGGYFLVNLYKKQSWGEYFSKYTAPLTAESLRALTQILLWSLAFVVPGVVMYCRLTFVPFIVFVDPTFVTQPDAVKRAKDLTKSCWGQIVFIVVVLGIIDLVFELTPSLLKIENLMARVCIDLTSFLFSLFSFVLLYIIFENLVRDQGKILNGAYFFSKWNFAS